MPDDPHARLGDISTLWTLVRQAHADDRAAAEDAIARLLVRYGGAVHKYFLGALRDPDAADELFQELSLRVVRGDFRTADPDKGRFRDFLKSVAYRLVADHHRRRQRAPLPIAPEAEPPTPADSTDGADREFLAGWVAHLVDRTWDALRRLQPDGDHPYYVVLRLRADRPQVSSEELAQEVTQRLGKTCSVAATRQMLHRGREKFADLLLDAVAGSVDDPTPERLTDELVILGLGGTCQAALQRRFAAG